jgi:predicted acylesterase/phospholipase RssA
VRTGLFLTPGAARSAYQVGAAQGLLAAGVVPDVVAASSVGALNGAFVATGQVDRLAALWSTWTDADIFGVDWAALVRGGVLWAPNLLHNRPQRRDVIDRHLSDDRLRPGVRFRVDLADLTTGEAPVFEWPGAPLPLADGVNASVAVPGAIAPVEALGDQWADGLTIDGFPLEAALLVTGVERAFVLGVAPRHPSSAPQANVLRAVLRAAEWNQYSETWLGLERTEARNRVLRAWAADRAAAVAAVEEEVGDADLRARLLAEVDRVYGDPALAYGRREVEVVPVLPDEEIEMFFTDYDPARSRRLLDLGRRDAERAVAALG